MLSPKKLQKNKIWSKFERPIKKPIATWSRNLSTSNEPCQLFENQIAHSNSKYLKVANFDPEFGFQIYIFQNLSEM